MAISTKTTKPIRVIVPDFDCSDELSEEVKVVENCLVKVVVIEVSEGINWTVDNGAIAVNSHCSETLSPIDETLT